MRRALPSSAGPPVERSAPNRDLSRARSYEGCAQHLINALRGGRSGSVASVDSQGFANGLTNVGTRKQMPLLVSAVAAKSMGLCEILIKAGADVLAKDGDGRNAFDVAMGASRRAKDGSPRSVLGRPSLAPSQPSPDAALPVSPLTRRAVTRLQMWVPLRCLDF